MRIERLLAGVLAVAGTGVALSPAIAAQHRPVFQGEVQVGLSGEKTCTLSVEQTRMSPGAVTFVVGNASRLRISIVRSPPRTGAGNERCQVPARASRITHNK